MESGHSSGHSPSALLRSPPGGPRRRRLSTQSAGSRTPGELDELDLGPSSGHRHQRSGGADRDRDGGGDGDDGGSIGRRSSGGSSYGRLAGIWSWDYAHAAGGGGGGGPSGGGNLAARGRVGNLFCVEITKDGSSGGQIYHEYTRAALLERLNARALQLQVPPTQAAVAAAGAAAAGAAVPVTAPGSALHSLLQPAVHHPSVTPSAAAMLSGAAPPGTPLPHGLPLAAALQAQGLLGSRQFGMGGGAGHRFSAFGGGGGGGGGYPGGGGGGGGGGHHGHFPGGPGGPGGRAAAAVQHGHVTYRDLHVIDPAMDTSSKPALLIRQGALLVSMPPLHAIITPDACLLFPEPGADSDLEPILSHLRKYQTGTLGGSGGGGGADGGKTPAADGGVALPGDPLDKAPAAVATVTTTATPRPDGNAPAAPVGLPLNASVESLGGSHGSARNAAAATTAGASVSTTAATTAAGVALATPPVTTASTDVSGSGCGSGSGAVELVPTPTIAVDGDAAAGLDLTAPTDGGGAPPHPPAQPPVLPAVKASAADSERLADDGAAGVDATPTPGGGGGGGGDNLATGAGGRGYVVGPFEYECLTTLLLTSNDIHDHELERLKIVADAVTHRRRRGEALAERLQQAEDATKHYIAALEAVEKAVDSTLETPEDLAGLVLSTPPPATIPGLLLAPVPATSPVVTIPQAASAAAATTAAAAAAAAIAAPHLHHYYGGGGGGSHFSAPPGSLSLSLAHHVHGANPALWAAGHGGGHHHYHGGSGSGATTPTAAYSGVGHFPMPHAPGTPTAALSVPGLPHAAAHASLAAHQQYYGIAPGTPSAAAAAVPGAGGLPHSPSIVAGFGAAGATAATPGGASGVPPPLGAAGAGAGMGGRSYSSAGLSLLAQQAQVQQAVAAAAAVAAASSASSTSSGTALPPDAQPRLLLQHAALAAAAASQPPRRAPSPAPPSSGGAAPATAQQQPPHGGGGKDDGADAAAAAAAAVAAAQAQQQLQQAQLQAAAATAAANDAILAGLLELGRQVEAVRFEELLEWYLAETENNLSDARLLVGRFDSERKSIQLELANSRNRLLKANIGIQLSTMCMAGCSMMSGWFGMNLDNGACGPEGCEVNGTQDRGRAIFILVVCLTTGIMMCTGIVLWRTILKNL